MSLALCSFLSVMLCSFEGQSLALLLLNVLNTLFEVTLMWIYVSFIYLFVFIASVKKYIQFLYLVSSSMAVDATVWRRESQMEWVWLLSSHSPILTLSPLQGNSLVKNKKGSNHLCLWSQEWAKPSFPSFSPWGDMAERETNTSVLTAQHLDATVPGASFPSQLGFCQPHWSCGWWNPHLCSSKRLARSGNLKGPPPPPRVISQSFSPGCHP